MTARLIRGGIALATMGGALALGFASPASAADTGVTVLEKIKQCESGGDYTAENPTSTASGAYQFIDSTFRSLSASAGYTHAADAPASVQDAAALELYNEQGTSPWAASASCWQAAGATGPSSQTNTGGNGTSGSTASSGSSSSSSTGSSGSSNGSTSGTQSGGVKKSSPGSYGVQSQQGSTGAQSGSGSAATGSGEQGATSAQGAKVGGHPVKGHNGINCK